MITLDEAKKVFELYPETKAYVPDYEHDIALTIDSYVFVIQTKDGYNNVIFAINGKPMMSLKMVMTAFRLICIIYGIEHLRIEGTPRRYGFLSKMFTDTQFYKEDNDKRNIFYVRT